MRLLLRDCRVNQLRGCCSIRGRSLQGGRTRDRLRKRQGQTEHEQDGKTVRGRDRKTRNGPEETGRTAEEVKKAKTTRKKSNKG